MRRHNMTTFIYCVQNFLIVYSLEIIGSPSDIDCKCYFQYGNVIYTNKI